MRKLSLPAVALALVLGSCGQQNNAGQGEQTTAPQQAAPAVMPAENTTSPAPANTAATPAAATSAGTQATTAKPAAAKTALVWAGDMDPICEMSVDRATVEDTAHYKGKIYGFCNPGCKETFKEDPAKYAKQ